MTQRKRKKTKTFFIKFRINVTKDAYGFGVLHHYDWSPPLRFNWSAFAMFCLFQLLLDKYMKIKPKIAFILGDLRQMYENPHCTSQS